MYLHQTLLTWFTSSLGEHYYISFHKLYCIPFTLPFIIITEAKLNLFSSISLLLLCTHGTHNNPNNGIFIPSSLRVCHISSYILHCTISAFSFIITEAQILLLSTNVTHSNPNAYPCNGIPLYLHRQQPEGMSHLLSHIVLHTIYSPLYHHWSLAPPPSSSSSIPMGMTATLPLTHSMDHNYIFTANSLRVCHISSYI